MYLLACLLMPLLFLYLLLNIEAFDPKLIYWKKGNCHLLLENARILLWIHLKRLKVKDSLKKNFWPLINLTDKCIYVQKGDENAYTAQERLTDLWLLQLRKEAPTAPSPSKCNKADKKAQNTIKFIFQWKSTLSFSKFLNFHVSWWFLALLGD